MTTNNNKTPLYILKANRAFKARGELKGQLVSPDLANLLSAWEDYGFISKGEFSRSIAQFFIDRYKIIK